MMTISRMRRHAPFGPTDPNFYMWGGVTDVINRAKLLKIGSRVPELEDPEKWNFPSKLFIALTTVLRYRADCDISKTVGDTSKVTSLTNRKLHHCPPVFYPGTFLGGKLPKSRKYPIGKESHVTRCLVGSDATFVYILRTFTKQSARS